ncbi:DNA-binding transcriptional regulator, XRE-family HTH domain [Dyella sp. OK004]|uniref:helix-turn-helix transcriptional regulator n=1 Tax=Dyella sp. OK004 TaxID=1855292 RepID=UPI0008E34908|nr:helix-turn-helix transcriptional regulator [Dyella sp. OK004]SFR95970.1 DNA-binding transcriptional regulator, XRE-family HTH domain [Dyella sp. OK004]
MAKRVPPTHPQARRQIAALGERLRAARLRRDLTQEMLAERVGVSVPTVAKLENGDPTTSLAIMLRVLTVLGLGADVDAIAAQDSLGRELQDSKRVRAPRRTKLAPRAPTVKPSDKT